MHVVELIWAFWSKPGNSNVFVDPIVPVGHIWKFDLEEHENTWFCNEVFFSKILMEPVMLSFLAKTENIKKKENDRIDNCGKVTEKQRKLLFAISKIIIKITRVELSYLDIGDSDYRRRSESS